MAAQQQYGSFVANTQVWDPNQIYDTDLKSEEALQELLVRMFQNLSLMAIVLNTKKSGFFVTTPFVTGEVFYPNPNNNSSTPAAATFRQIFQVVVTFGSLPNTGMISLPHGIPITPAVQFISIIGAANNPSTSFLPLPYVAVSDPAREIELYADATNVYIVTAGNRSSYTAQVVLKYITT